MKHYATTRAVLSFTKYMTILLTIFFMLFSKIASAHKVTNYVVPCFTQGSSVTISVSVINTDMATIFIGSIEQHPAQHGYGFLTAAIQLMAECSALQEHLRYLL